jgi:hypothetical protein
MPKFLKRQDSISISMPFSVYPSMRKYRAYTDNDIIFKTSQVKSMGQLLKSLGLIACGGNYATIKRQILRLNINTSHWTGGDKGWWRGKQLKDFSQYNRNKCLKIHLIKQRGHKCESCSNTTWLGYPIKLELHHLDGDRTHNNPTNLQLLCPNCHSFTDGFRDPRKGF